MGTTGEILKLLGDPTRVRMVRLLGQEELTVAEMQEILAMKQSRISTQLAQLKGAGMVVARKSGKNSIYGIGESVPREVRVLVDRAAAELEEGGTDLAGLELVRRKRADVARQYFDQLAGKFGKAYVPGRSWKGLAETLLKLMPPLVIADLGAGEGTFSQLLAGRAERVIAVDSSEKMVEYGAEVARSNGFSNLEYRVGDIQAPPIGDGEVDLAFFSQSLHHAVKPATAVKEAFRIVKPGGRIVVLDLLKHDFEEARELYADVWLGFAEVELYEMVVGAGFENVEVGVVDRESEGPKFETLMAIGDKC